jgi:hypothetical protein
MAKKLSVLVGALALIIVISARAEEPKKAAPVKSPKVTEAKLHETEIGRIEHAVKKAVSETMVSKGSGGNWEYMAKSMKPPKNDTWLARWNELGAEGWEAFDHFENIYIFKRPSYGVKAEGAAPVDKKAEKKALKEKEKAEKAADQEKAKAEKEAEKAAKKAEKAKEKAEKKAAKEAEKAAKAAAKKAK